MYMYYKYLSCYFLVGKPTRQRRLCSTMPFFMATSYPIIKMKFNAAVTKSVYYIY